jgi:hypothetical protein
MDHLSAKSELQNKQPPKVSLNLIVLEGFAMLAIAGVMLQVI